MTSLIDETNLREEVERRLEKRHTDFTFCPEVPWPSPGYITSAVHCSAFIITGSGDSSARSEVAQQVLDVSYITRSEAQHTGGSGRAVGGWMGVVGLHTLEDPRQAEEWSCREKQGRAYPESPYGLSLEPVAG